MPKSTFFTSGKALGEAPHAAIETCRSAIHSRRRRYPQYSQSGHFLTEDAIYYLFFAIFLPSYGICILSAAPNAVISVFFLAQCGTTRCHASRTMYFGCLPTTEMRMSSYSCDSITYLIWNQLYGRSHCSTAPEPSESSNRNI
jgi:hypothetical protein